MWGNIKVEYVDINELRPSEYNPRKASKKEYEDLKKSIERFGLVDPIIVNSAENRKNIVVGGHFRLRVAKDLGIKQVPVVYVNIPDIEREKELNLRLNKDLGEWDFDLLANFDEDLLKSVGFESEELDKVFDLDSEQNPKEDEVPELRKETHIKYGDIFQLGQHRLMCGDATKKEDVEKLMKGEKADMVFTDPPYAVYGSSTALQNKIVDDKMIRPFFRDVLEMSKTFSKLFSHIYVFSDWRSYAAWWEASKTVKLPIKNCIVWDKGGGLGTLYMLCHEFIIFLINIPEQKKLTEKRKSGIKTIIGKPNVWRFNRESKREHLSAKPIELCEYGIQNSSERGHIVLDLFGGSGSTLIACEKLNRRCYMMEIEPIYCEIICERFEKFTGKKKKKD